MNYLYVFFIFGVLFNLIENGSLETWGNISGSYLFQNRVTKSKIPFFTRSATINYPEVNIWWIIRTLIIQNVIFLYILQKHPDDKGKLVYRTLRGIEHVNLVNKKETGCGDPTVEILEGGIYYPNVKIEVTSERGCPLDSVIFYYGAR